MIELQQDSLLPISKLSAVFNDTTNSYKFYWFLAILEEIKENPSPSIKMEKLYTRMVNSVWYPLDFFKLSFGKSDGFKKISNYISSKQVVDNSTSAEPVINQLNRNLDEPSKQELFRMMKQLVRWVPYRFIRPFFAEETRHLNDSKVNGVIRDLASSTETSTPHLCMYHFTEDSIEIHECWLKYLHNNIGILSAFVYWHLTKYVQKNNPNVIGISEKLFKPAQRNLRKNLEAWNTFISINGGITCIYSGEIITNDLSLDHFLPWSFTVHDLNWNILPVRKSVNSSKNDSLPSEEYIKPFAELQFMFFNTIVENEKCRGIMEDYSQLFNMNLTEIKNISLPNFESKIRATIMPMTQIAANMGFKTNWKYGVK
jgi:hypothetical protein